MPLPKLITGLAIVLTLVVVSCNILKQGDSEKEIRDFLASLQNSLTLPENEILKQFEARQSPESVLTAIHILQNKEYEYIECVASFGQAEITKDSAGMRVIIPVRFKPKNIEVSVNDDEREAQLTLWLQLKNKELVVSKVDGSEFYDTFSSLRNRLAWQVERKQELDKRVPIYARAKELQLKYDSVIWYATYKDKTYFYVINGQWDFEARHKSRYEMGLVDDKGSVIIPMQYDLIGTIGFDSPNRVEVSKGGKSGLFDIYSGKLVIDPLYSMIIPYGIDDIPTLAKKASIYGWINYDNEFQEGLPTVAAQDWINSFSFIPKNLRIKGDAYSLCEIPNPDNAGSGVVIPPSYLVSSGLFNEMISGITTTPFQFHGWTDYLETQGTIMERISENITAIFTTISERYLDGREEFYTQNRVMFVNAKHDTLSVTNLSADTVLHIRHLENGLLEIKSPCSYCWEPYPADDAFIPEYAYFAIDQDVSVRRLNSSRIFPSTEFVKIDSSYLAGKFTSWTEEGEREHTFLSLSTIIYMRNEILASYGYIFGDETVEEQFKNNSWYKPRYSTIESFKDQISENDQHNLAFLERIIELMKTTPA